jgi:signal transduction histidine kinase
MIEPGLLEVFRWYALLRFGLLSLALIWESVFAFNRRFDFLARDTSGVYLAVIGLMIFLVAYLFSGKLQSKLKKAYIPIALVLAIGSVYLEQYSFTPRAGIWQPDSFLFILLIFVSWQYDYRAILLYSLAIAAGDYYINLISRPAILFFGGVFTPQPAEVVVVFGRLLTRTASFVIIGLIINRLVNAQREQRRELALANSQLRQHAATLEQLAVSRERNRLSRELHDTLAHTLSALTVQLEALGATWRKMPAKASTMVDKMLDAARGGLNETRRTLKNLRASQLEELGLAAAVKTLAEGVAQRNDLKLKTEISLKKTDLASDVEQSFYRVSQEALENIVRHADAKAVKLSLIGTRKKLKLTIQDDGKGFRPRKAAAKQRLGLQLMRERADLIDAEFAVESSPDQGTTVRMSI